MELGRLVRDHRLIVVGTAVVALTTAGAVSAAVIGNTPAWLQLIPSVVTFFGVLVAYQTVRANTLNRRDDEAAAARLLVLESSTSMYSHGSNKDVYWTLVLTLRNASTSQSFTNLHIEGVTFKGYGCQQTIRDWIDEGHNQKLKLLLPGASIESGWVLPKPGYLLDEGDDIPLQVRYIYTDGNGRRWRRLDALEPQRIKGTNTRIAERNALFDSRMRDISNGSDRTLPPEIDVKVRSAFPRQ